MQDQAAAEHWTFTVGPTPATEKPLWALCGLVVPDNWWVNASFDPCVPTKSLPAQWDWREHNGVTSVKNQGWCGSCWAFGTIGPMESAILIHDKVEVDLSEQWLVSCNKNHWGCNGGWYADDYLQYKTDRFNGSGAVLEKNFPYNASDLPCNGPYHHSYHLDSWKFVGVGSGVPKTDSIKQAIYTYGPISCAVAVNHAWGAYTGGVFNNNTPAGINHCVTLVGWNDSLGDHGCWILKNSWGPDWGDHGFMEIEYGCCQIGYAACYVVYPVKTAITIHSGLFGGRVELSNRWNTTITDLAWTITMKGGLQHNVNLTLTDIIPELQPSQTVSIRLPYLGLGKVQIMVTTRPSNAGRQTTTVTGYLLGASLLAEQP